MLNNSISIILPVKNEPYLPILVSELSQILQQYPYEIIIVTSDKTKQSLPTLPPSPNIKIYKSYADSLERAILLGFSVSTCSKIIVMDADGSHPPILIPSMIQALNTHEMVIASRFTQSKDENQYVLDALHIKHLRSKNLVKSKYIASPFRYLVTYFFTKYAQLSGSTLTDPMSGFFGIQRQLLDKIQFKPYTWKTALEINNKLRPTTLELPFTFEKRKVGKSKSSWKIAFKLLWDIMEGSL